MDNGFDRRMAEGTAHERAVEERLRSLGWTVGAFGQSQLDQPVRDILRFIDTPLRWLPDRIAVTRAGRGVAVLVDAKAGRTDTPNYALEAAAVSALAASQDLWKIPAFFVMSDMGVLSPGSVLANGELRSPSRREVGGSGTPFYLVPKAVAIPFDEVFRADRSGYAFTQAADLVNRG